MYKTVLTVIKGDELEVFSMLKAFSETVRNVKEALVFDVVAKKQYHTILKDSGLVRNVFEKTPKESYSLIFKVNPTEKDSYKFGEEDRDKKVADYKKFLGEAPKQEFPVQPYSMYATICQKFSNELKKIGISFSFRNCENPVETKPLVRVSSKVAKEVKRKLRKSILDIDKNPVKDNYYLVFCLTENMDASFRILLTELEKETNLDILYLENDGHIWGSEEVLSKEEQIALIENRNCLGVVAEDYRAQLAWMFSKPFLVYLVDLNNEQEAWKSPRNVRTIVWDKHNKDLLKHWRAMIDLNLKEFVISWEEPNVRENTTEDSFTEDYRGMAEDQSLKVARQ